MSSEWKIENFQWQLARNKLKQKMNQNEKITNSRSHAIIIVEINFFRYFL